MALEDGHDKWVATNRSNNTNHWRRREGAERKLVQAFVRRNRQCYEMKSEQRRARGKSELWFGCSPDKSR